MAEKSKTREITIIDDEGVFNTIFKRFTGEKDYDFQGIATLRKLLNNEKARLLHTIKTKKPNSIYSLAKMLERDFKSVSDDIKLLEKFGFIELVAEKTGNRERHKPLLIIDTMYVKIKI